MVAKGNAVECASSDAVWCLHPAEHKALNLQPASGLDSQSTIMLLIRPSVISAEYPQNHLINHKVLTPDVSAHLHLHAFFLLSGRMKVSDYNKDCYLLAREAKPSIAAGKKVAFLSGVASLA
jgi:hypothetical protein